MNLEKLAQVMQLTQSSGLADLETLARINAAEAQVANQSEQNELRRLGLANETRLLESNLLDATDRRDVMNPFTREIERSKLAQMALDSQRGFDINTNRNLIDADRNAFSREKLAQELNIIKMLQERDLTIDERNRGAGAVSDPRDAILSDYLKQQLNR